VWDRLDGQVDCWGGTSDLGRKEGIGCPEGLVVMGGGGGWWPGVVCRGGKDV
jgi:hypothetical protein